jgi:hypothetical protein
LGTGGFSIANPGSDGGTTFFANESAPGGKGAGLSGKLGGNGGSGGSGGNYTNSAYSLIGGSDGSDGQSTLGQNGLGSGETTRAFGSPTGTLYAGGGGGGSYESGSTTTGGAGGGGNGGKRLSSLNATPGGTNTGGGGGGGMEQGNGANGGSGIIILRYPTDFVADFSGGTQTLEKVQDGDYWVETIIGTESQNESVTFSFA